MMQIKEVVGDLILIVLEGHEPLKKIGIEQDKIFVYVNGYDEHISSIFCSECYRKRQN